jgi:predicted nucleotidyltransferase
MRIAPDIEIDERALAAVCDRYGIAELKIFGSRARGAAGPGSDIDVLYTLRPGRMLGWDIEQLADELSGLLGHPGGPRLCPRPAPAAAARGPRRSPAFVCSVTCCSWPR